MATIVGMPLSSRFLSLAGCLRVSGLLSVIAVLGAGSLSVRAEAPEIKVSKFDRDKDGGDDTFLTTISYDGAPRMKIYKSTILRIEEVAHFVNGEIVSVEKKKLEDARPFEITTYSLLDPETITQMVTYDRERNAYVQADPAAIAKQEATLKREKARFEDMFPEKKKTE